METVSPVSKVILYPIHPHAYPLHHRLRHTPLNTVLKLMQLITYAFNASTDSIRLCLMVDARKYRLCAMNMIKYQEFVWPVTQGTSCIMGNACWRVPTWEMFRTVNYIKRTARRFVPSVPKGTTEKILNVRQSHFYVPHTTKPMANASPALRATSNCLTTHASCQPWDMTHSASTTTLTDTVCLVHPQNNF